MQVTFVTFFAFLIGLTIAVPIQIESRARCDIAKCAIALGPAAVDCGVAVAQGGADPIFDITCIAGALDTVVNTPEECVPCAKELGIPEAVAKVEKAGANAVHSVAKAGAKAVHTVENAGSKVVNGAKDAVSDVGNSLGNIF